MAVDDDNFGFADFGDPSNVKPAHVGGGDGKKLSKSHLKMPHMDLSGGGDNGNLLTGWYWPVGLIGLWLILFVFEKLVFHGQPLNQSTLTRLPVLVGHMSISGGTWGAAFLAHLYAWCSSHAILGVLGKFLWILLLLVFSIFSALGSLLWHLSFGSLLSDGVLLILLMVAGRLIHWQYKDLLNRWVAFGLLVYIPYLIAEFVGVFFRLAAVHHQPINPNTWYFLMWNSPNGSLTITVAMMGLAGLILAQVIKSAFHPWAAVWIGLVLVLVATILLVMLLGPDFHMKTLTTLNWMNHFMGYMSVSAWMIGMVWGFVASLPGDPNQQMGFE